MWFIEYFYLVLLVCLIAITVEAQKKKDRESCLKDCFTTTESDPQCASDGKTYGNKGKVACQQKCGNREFRNFEAK